MGMGFFWGMMKIFLKWDVVIFVQLYEFTKKHEFCTLSG